MALGALAGIAIGATAISTIADFLGNKKASKAAKKQAETKAEAEGKLTDERVRQLDIQERTQYGETIAGYASGGVQARVPGLDPAQSQDQFGSPQKVIQEATREFAAERAFTKDVGASNAMQIMQQGRATADQYRYQGYANVASGISKILGMWSG